MYCLILDREEGGEREKETSICCSTYLYTHWLILVCTLTSTELETLACKDDALTN